MRNDLSRTVLMGHLGADATRKSDKAPVTFRMAVTSRWKDNAGDEQKHTEWHNITVFGNRGKYAETLKKGERVYVEGELRSNTRPKTIGTETVNITYWEIIATDIERLTVKKDDEE
jgi:single-strand DNA-binding protein